MNARTLFLDLETSPITVHSWSLRDLSVGLNQIVELPRIIGVAYRWEDMRSAKYLSTWDEGEQHMLEFAHSLLDEADAVVGWNSQGFDVKWLNGEFIRVGLTPPAPFKNVDLYRTAKAAFRWPSYKLQYASEVLLGSTKLPTGGHQLWVDCLNGDEKARAKMARYARRDVDLLPPLLKKMRPWLGNQVNFALIGGTDGCPKCGSEERQSRGLAYTATAAFPQYRCNGCGAWYRGNKRDFGVENVGIAR